MAGAAKKIEMDKKIIQAGRYDNKSTAEERDAFLVSRSAYSIAFAQVADTRSVRSELCWRRTMKKRRTTTTLTRPTS